MTRTIVAVSSLLVVTQGSVLAGSGIRVVALTAGSSLAAGTEKASPGGRYVLRMQVDGNLVWYDGQKPIWETGTCGAKNARCDVQKDGNLVVYGERGGTPEPLWASDTDWGSLETLLACQDDGNLVLYLKMANGKYRAMWDVKGHTANFRGKMSELAKHNAETNVWNVNILTPFKAYNKSVAVVEAGGEGVDLTFNEPKAPVKGEATVAFEKDVVDQVVFSEPYQTIRGVPLTITPKWTCETAMSITGTVGMEVGTKATLGAEAIASISGEIKTKVEASLSVTIGKSHTYEQSVTLDGKDVLAIKAVWVERYRRGTATLADGRKVEVLVRVGARLKVEKPD